MSSPQPLLILTDDDLLAERWQGLGQSPVRARNLEGLDTWRAAGHRLVLVDLGNAKAGQPPLWTQPGWQRNAAGLAILAALAGVLAVALAAKLTPQLPPVLARTSSRVSGL